MEVKSWSVAILSHHPEKEGRERENALGGACLQFTGRAVVKPGLVPI